MSKRKTKYDPYFLISVDNVYTCKNCKKFSKKVDVAKNGTTSLSFHLKQHHKSLYKELEQKSKPEADFAQPPEAKKRKLDELKQLKIHEDYVHSTTDPKSEKIDKSIMELLASAVLGQDSAHCFAHRLQLAIKDVLNQVNDFDVLLTKIKKLIQKIRKSYKLVISSLIFENVLMLQNLKNYYF